MLSGVPPVYISFIKPETNDLYAIPQCRIAYICVGIHSFMSTVSPALTKELMIGIGHIAFFMFHAQYLEGLQLQLLGS